MRDSVGLALRGASKKRDWTQGSTFKNLLSLSWPLLVSSTVNTLGPTVDMVWVGRLGSDSIAGVGVSGLAVQVANALVQGLFVGTVAMVARLVGSRDEKAANRVAQQAFVVAAGFSLIMAIIGIFLADEILLLLGVSPEVVSEGAVYMRIQFVGMITMSALQVAQSIMQASGDTLTPLKISVSYRVFQIFLCPALIFGWLFFPQLGVRGAALSNVIAQGLGAGIAVWILLSGRTRLKISFNNFRLDRNIIWRTIKIGIPGSVTAMERNFAGLVLVGFIAPFGTLAVAAHSLSQRIDSFIQMLSNGFGNSGGVLAGQNLGAKRPDRASRTAWLAVGLASAVGLLSCVVVWFWIEPILRIFTTEPDLVGMAATFLKIQIVGYLVWGMVITFSQILNGVGDTLVPMVTNMVTVWGIQIPLAYILPRITGLDVYAVRWAIVAGIMGRAVIYPIYFNLGRWKHKRF